MSRDFRTKQIQVSQIISSGSSGTNAKIVVYDIAGQDQGNLNVGSIAFDTSNIGDDIFLYVSGGVGGKNSSGGGIAVFGGDVHVSGNFTVDGADPATADWIADTTGTKLRTTSSVAVDSEGNFADTQGADVYFYVSGTFGSGSASDSIALFGGDVRISGVLAVGSGTTFIDSTGIKTVNGSTSVPGYSFAGESDTGIYLGTGGQIAWTTEGAQRMTLNAAQMQIGAAVVRPFSDGTQDLGLINRRWGDFHIKGQHINSVAATGNEILFEYSGSVNKSNSGDYTALKVDVEETAVPGTDNRLLDLRVGGTSQFFVSNSGVVLAGSGTIARPAYSFVSDPDTGMYLITTNAVGISIAGTQMFSVTAGETVIRSTGRLRPGVNGSIDLGKAATNRWANFYATVSQLQNGSTSAPSYTFESQTDTGLYLINSQVATIGIAVSGSEVMTIGKKSGHGADIGLYVSGTLTSSKGSVDSIFVLGGGALISGTLYLGPGDSGAGSAAAGTGIIKGNDAEPVGARYGGNLVISGGAGGIASGLEPGGGGGNLDITSGPGGHSSKSGQNAGIGGNVVVTAGTGGNSSNTGDTGVGGNILIMAGVGGEDTVGSATGADGGSVSIAGGDGGDSVGNGGSGGDIFINAGAIGSNGINDGNIHLAANVIRRVFVGPTSSYNAGADVLVYVSGVVGSKNSSTQGVSLFTGDVHISGNITADGTGLGVGADTDWTSNGTELRTTSSVAIDSEGGFASAQGSDVFFYVSGSTGGKGTDGVAVLGGDVQISGTLYTDGVDDILMPRIGAATFDSLEDMQNVFHSPGWVSGGTITTDALGFVDVASGTGLIRATTGTTDQILWFDFPSSGSLQLTSASANYVGIEYNAGTPQVVVRTTENWNLQTEFALGVAVFEPDKVHIECNPQAVGDHALNMLRRNYEVMPLARDERGGGIILGGSNRNVTVSAGVIWDRLNRFSLPARDTSNSDVMTEYYQDGSGSWIIVTGSTEWNNSQYDDGTGTLANLIANRYTNRWFYTEVDDGDLTYVFGQAQYVSLAAAEIEGTPSSLPLRLSTLGRLIGRMIIQEGSAGPADQVDSVFSTVFTPTAASNHPNLTGLGGDDHTQYILVDGTRAFTGDVKISGALSVGSGSSTVIDDGGHVLAIDGSSNNVAYGFANGGEAAGMYRAGTTQIHFNAPGFVFETGGVPRFSMSTTNLSPSTDNSKDLGSTNANWRNFYIHGETINTVNAANGDEILFDYSGDVSKSISGNYTGIKLDVSESAVNGTDNRLLDLQVNGSSKFFVSNSGQLLAQDGTATVPAYSFAGNTKLGIRRNGAQVTIVAGGVDRFAFSTVSFIPVVDNSRNLGGAVTRWSRAYVGPGTSALASVSVGETDVGLFQPAANQLGITANGSERVVIGDSISHGADVGFYVSGTFGSGSADDSIAVFGGDVRISGTLAVGSGSAFISDDRIVLTSASMQNIGGDLTFYDDSNLGGQTLSDLASGGGGSSPWTDNGIGDLFTTSSVSIDSEGGIATDQGSDVYFYASGTIGAKDSDTIGVGLFGGDLHVSGNLTVDGASMLVTSTLGNLMSFGITDYALTTATSSNPESVGQVFFDSTDFGDEVVLRAILIGSAETAVASIKLMNLDDLLFVDLDGVGETVLSSSGITPTLVSSTDLRSAANFNAVSSSMYELQVYTTTGSQSVTVGGAALLTSGSFISTAGVTDTDWTDSGTELRTTSSIAIDSEGGYASAQGSDVYFYVSGGSGVDIALFNGDIVASGNITAGPLEGTAGNPQYSFTGNSNTGMYRAGGTVQFTVNGNRKLLVGVGAIQPSIPIAPASAGGTDLGFTDKPFGSVYSQIFKAEDGSAGAPSYTFDDKEDTGIHLINSQVATIGVTVSGSEVMAIGKKSGHGDDIAFYVSGGIGTDIALFNGDVYSSGAFLAGDGTVDDPAYSFISNEGSGMFLNENGDLTFVDTDNSAGKTLSELVAGSGASPWTDNGTGDLFTTSSVAIDSEGAIASAQGSDVYFYVSGGIGTDVSVFGGDVKLSGALSVGSGSSTVIDDGGHVLAIDGLVGTPAYSFASDPDTGMFLNTTGQLYFALAGANKIRMTGPSVIIEANTFQIQPGAAANPGMVFEGDTNTGIYRNATDILGIAAGGTERVLIGNNISHGDNVSFYVSGGIGTDVALFNGDIHTSGNLSTEGSLTYVPASSTESTTTQAIASDQDGNEFYYTNNSGCTVTVNQAHAGCVVRCVAEDATGDITFAAGSGVTLRRPATFTLVSNEQYSVVYVRWKSATVVYLEGDLGIA